MEGALHLLLCFCQLSYRSTSPSAQGLDTWVYPNNPAGFLGKLTFKKLQ